MLWPKYAMRVVEFFYFLITAHINAPGLCRMSSAVPLPTYALRATCILPTVDHFTEPHETLRWHSRQYRVQLQDQELPVGGEAFGPRQEGSKQATVRKARQHSKQGLAIRCSEGSHH